MTVTTNIHLSKPPRLNADFANDSNYWISVTEYVANGHIDVTLFCANTGVSREVVAQACDAFNAVIDAAIKPAIVEEDANG